MVVGGPTTVLDLGGLRIVSDPTFDAPGPHGYLTKTAGPASGDDALGQVDLVLVSHDNHPDNLDDRGRALALAAPSPDGWVAFCWVRVDVSRGWYPAPFGQKIFDLG